MTLDPRMEDSNLMTSKINTLGNDINLLQDINLNIFKLL